MYEPSGPHVLSSPHRCVLALFSVNKAQLNATLNRCISCISSPGCAKEVLVTVGGGRKEKEAEEGPCVRVGDGRPLCRSALSLSPVRLFWTATGKTTTGPSPGALVAVSPLSTGRVGGVFTRIGLSGGRVLRTRAESESSAQRELRSVFKSVRSLVIVGLSASSGGGDAARARRRWASTVDVEVGEDGREEDL